MAKNKDKDRDKSIEKISNEIRQLTGELSNLVNSLTQQHAELIKKHDADKRMEQALQNLSATISDIGKTTKSQTIDVDKLIKLKADSDKAMLAGAKADQISNTMMSKLITALKKSDSSISIPKLIEQLKGANINDAIIESIDDMFKETDKLIIGSENLATEMANQITGVFDNAVKKIESIPGGKLFSKIFKFDQVRKSIYNNITLELMSAGNKGKMSFKSLANVAKTAFAEIGVAMGAATAGITLAIGAIILLLKAVYDEWNIQIESAKKLRDETGLTGDEALKLTKINQKITKQYMSMGVDMDVLAGSTAALVNEFQTINAITEGMQRNAGILVGTLGMAPDSAAKTLRLFKNMGIESDKMSLSLVGAVSQSAKLGGVAPSEVFKDLSESSREIYLYFKGNISNAAKAAIELRRMGTSLKEVANISKSLLDFESSITSELEASVLAGTQLDFSRARYAAFTGDLVGQQNAILDQIEKINDFENMNVIQKEAIAKASGMEIDQLENMISQRKAINEMDFDKKRRYEESINAIKKFRTENKANLILENQRLLMQEKMAKTWDNIVNILASTLFPLFDGIYNIVNDIATEIQKWLSTEDGKETMKQMKADMADIAESMRVLMPLLLKIFEYMTKISLTEWSTTISGFKQISNIANSFFGKTKKARYDAQIDFMKTAIKNQLKWASIFGKNKNIDKMLKQTDIISSALKNQNYTVGDFIKSIWNKTYKSITSFTSSITKSIGKYLSDKWNSMTSYISSSINFIKNGIINIWNSIQTTVSETFSSIYESLSSPFTMAFSYITSKFESVGKYIIDWWNKIYNVVLKPISNAWDFISGSDNTKENINIDTIPKTATGGITTKPQIRMVGEEGPEAIIPLNKMDNYTNDNTVLVSKMDELIGKIGNTDVIRKLDKLITVIESLDLNMDGKKVGELISRSSPSIGMG